MNLYSQYNGTAKIRCCPFITTYNLFIKIFTSTELDHKGLLFDGGRVLRIVENGTKRINISKFIVWEP